MTFAITRSRAQPFLWIILFQDPASPKMYEAHVLDVDRRDIEKNYDIEVDPANSGETYEAITLHPRKADTNTTSFTINHITDEKSTY